MRFNRTIRRWAALTFPVLLTFIASACAVISNPINDAALPETPFRELIEKAATYQGETVADVDTGAKYYTSENMDDADIAPLLYD